MKKKTTRGEIILPKEKRGKVTKTARGGHVAQGKKKIGSETNQKAEGGSEQTKLPVKQKEVVAVGWAEQAL